MGQSGDGKRYIYWDGQIKFKLGGGGGALGIPLIRSSEVAVEIFLPVLSEILGDICVCAHLYSTTK